MLMVSGGVEATRENILAWIKAGAVALNIGSDLIRKDLVKLGNFEGIRRMVEQCRLWIREGRKDLEHVGRAPPT